jgi:RecA-family ATPase
VNGSGSEGGIVSSSHRPQNTSWDDLRDDHTSSSSIEATTPTGGSAVALFELPPPGPTQWFVKGIFESGLPVGFYGMSGALKTYMTIHLILSLLDPDTHDWYGYEIPTMENILFVDYELRQDVIHRRALKVLKGMEKAEGRDIPSQRLGNLHYYDGKKATSRDESVDEALRIAKGNSDELVVVDSFGFAMGGDQEKQEAVTAFQIKLERFLNEGMELFITDLGFPR